MNSKVIAILITVALFLIGAAFTASYNANAKADAALEQVSTVKSEISGMNEKLKSISDNTNRIMDYFKLTPK